MKKLNIKRLLDSKDLTISEFSKMIGMNINSLNNILDDMGKTEKYMYLFAEKLDINPDLLFEFVEELSTSKDEKHRIFTIKDMNKLIDDILSDIKLQ